MFKLKNVCLAALLSLAAGAASAAVVSINIISSNPGGVQGVIGIPPGNAVGADNINLKKLFAFNELQNVTLGSDLAIDVVAGTIAAGTTISSHYIAFNPKNASSVVATVTFSSKILGLIITKAGLEASNYLGNPAVTYNSVALTGLEDITDTVSFSDDFTSLSWRASNPGDHIRVITAAVPLPAGGLLLVGAVGGLALLRRRKSA